MTPSQQELAVGLMKIGAIRFGNFRLKLHEKEPDAPLSPIYVDLRIVRSFPEIIDPVVQVYQQLSEGIIFDAYADVPTAATPITAVLSYKTKIPMISPRSDKKRHGLSRLIDGRFEQGQKVLVIDDLITNAESKLEAITTLEQNGLAVAGIIVLIDRGQGGFTALQSQGYLCRKAFDLHELVAFYRKSALVSEEDYRRTLQYLGRQQ